MVGAVLLLSYFAPARSVAPFVLRAAIAQPGPWWPDRVLSTGVLYPESLPPTEVAAGSPA